MLDIQCLVERLCVNKLTLNVIKNEYMLIGSRQRISSITDSIFIVGVYFPSSNAAIHMYRECMDILEDIIHQLHYKGTLVILGDFNAHISDFGGSRSFDSINEKGKELIELMQRTNFKSVNSQLFCTGSIETFYGQDRPITTTIDHILMKVDELFLVSDCSVENENCNNLSFHLPIFCSLNIHLLHHVRSNMIEPVIKYPGN